jgi:hypothetical protein
MGVNKGKPLVDKALKSFSNVLANDFCRNKALDK